MRRCCRPFKAKRRALAEAARVPAYVIFNRQPPDRDGGNTARDVDAMARITGVGRHQAGALRRGFPVGESPARHTRIVHPARRKLAGRDAGTVYDRLLAVQADLSRGGNGTHKPMTLFVVAAGENWPQQGPATCPR